MVDRLFRLRKCPVNASMRASLIILWRAGLAEEAGKAYDVRDVDEAVRRVGRHVVGCRRNYLHRCRWRCRW